MARVIILITYNTLPTLEVCAT